MLLVELEEQVKLRANNAKCTDLAEGFLAKQAKKI